MCIHVSSINGVGKCECSMFINKYSALKVEAEILKQQEAKRGLSSKSEAQDKAISIMRLR